MNLCTNCGVELDNDISACPLCGINIGERQNTEKAVTPDHYPSDIILLHKTEKRRYLWELTGIIAFSGITVCSIVDLVIGKHLSWSLYADTSIFAAWIALTLILLKFKKYFIVFPGLLLTILLMLFLFDLFSPPLNWFFGLGLPLTLALFVSVSIITVLWKVAQFKGFNILALAFIILSGYCIVIELFIDKYLYSTIEIRWSAIVAASIFPIALILLFMHYRMKKGKRLDSYFHV
jgi:hypothetical protein